MIRSIAQSALLIALAAFCLSAEGAEGAEGKSLFDGKTLGKWKVVTEFDFKEHGKIHVTDGKLMIERGKPAAGVKWSGKFPKNDYEVTFEAMRVAGDDFFCGMTFPTAKGPLTLVIGGWGGSVTGLSSIDGEPAVENETAGYREFKQKKWYRIRLRVTGPKIEAWIDKEQIVELKTADRKFSIYWEMEPCLPFGICTWNTSGALRDIRVRPIGPKEKKTAAKPAATAKK